MYLDKLLQTVSSSKFYKTAESIISDSNDKIFEQLDSDVLTIGSVPYAIRMPFRIQQTHREIRKRKINCFGISEEREITAEELDNLRKERALKAERKIQQIAQQKQIREQQYQLNQQYYSREKPLYQKWQEVDQQIEEQLLEERKQKLESIKNNHKPFKHGEFEEHWHKVQEYQTKRSRPRIQSFSPSFEKSQFYSFIEKEKQLILEKEQAEIRLKKELYEKKKKYSQDVKLKIKLTPRVNKNQLMIQSQIKKQSKYELNTSCDITTQESQLPKIPKVRHFSESKAPSDWQRLAQSKKLSQIQKNEQIMLEARRLSELALKQEQLNRVRGIDSSDVDELIINSIKAKLTVLEN